MQVTTGGTTLKDDIMRLYNVVHILVGTPGRVLDLADKGIANLKDCTTLIMDEVRVSPLFVPLPFFSLLVLSVQPEKESVVILSLPGVYSGLYLTE